MPAPEWLDHLPLLILRTLLLFLLVLLVMRWTGKRTVSALAPFDLAVVIMIGEVAAIPIAELSVDLLHGVVPVLLLGALHIALASANLHNHRLEAWTEGRPALLVKDGRPLLANMRRERVSHRDLAAALRLKNIHDLRDVEEAWMEHSGGISVMLRAEAQPVSQGVLQRWLRPAAPGIKGGAVPGSSGRSVPGSLGRAAPWFDSPAGRAVVQRVYRALTERLGLDAAGAGPRLDQGRAPARPGAAEHWEAKYDERTQEKGAPTRHQRILH
jgi:uncharacterized membrane protein YcaP (DUF421 family)